MGKPCILKTRSCPNSLLMLLSWNTPSFFSSCVVVKVLTSYVAPLDLELSKRVDVVSILYSWPRDSMKTMNVILKTTIPARVLEQP